MRKKKDGTIIASLTEVKNKTGDIFSLVDEYGEVVLTSYNKPKYVISKMSVGDRLEIDEEPAKEKKAKSSDKPRKSGLKRVTETVKSIAKKSEPKVEEKVVEMKNDEPTLISSALVTQLSNLEVWDRNSKGEQKYIKAILTPLQ